MEYLNGESLETLLHSTAGGAMDELEVRLLANGRVPHGVPYVERTLHCGRHMVPCWRCGQRTDSLLLCSRSSAHEEGTRSYRA